MRIFDHLKTAWEDPAAEPGLQPPRGNMMVRLRIAAKIWLSIGIFILGFIVFTVLSQIQGLSTESRLDDTSRVLYPAALRSHEAEAAFEEAVKDFGDAVVVQERSSLERGKEGARRAVRNLLDLGAMGNLAPLATLKPPVSPGRLNFS